MVKKRSSRLTDDDNEELYFKVENRSGHYAIIKLYKDSSRWHEKTVKDKYDIIVRHTRYMGYLERPDLTNWLKREYYNVEEITDKEAMSYR